MGNPAQKHAPSAKLRPAPYAVVAQTGITDTKVVQLEQKLQHDFQKLSNMMHTMQADMQRLWENSGPRENASDAAMTNDQHQELLERFDAMEGRLSMVEDKSDECFTDIQAMLQELVSEKRAKTTHSHQAKDGK